MYYAHQMPFIVKHFYFYCVNNKKICRRYQFRGGWQFFFSSPKTMCAVGVCSQFTCNILAFCSAFTAVSMGVCVVMQTDPNESANNNNNKKLPTDDDDENAKREISWIKRIHSNGSFVNKHQNKPKMQTKQPQVIICIQLVHSVEINMMRRAMAAFIVAAMPRMSLDVYQNQFVSCFAHQLNMIDGINGLNLLRCACPLTFRLISFYRHCVWSTQ